MTPTPQLSPATERRIRRSATVFVIFVAVAAAVLSFSGLHELALSSGFNPLIAWLFPLATDVAVAAFSLAVLHHSLTGMSVWYPWARMMLGVGVSVAGNVWAAPDDFVSRLVHAWPPIVFALSFEALTRLIRHRIDVALDVAHQTPAAVTIRDTPSQAPQPHAPAATASPMVNEPNTSIAPVAPVAPLAPVVPAAPVAIEPSLAPTAPSSVAEPVETVAPPLAATPTPQVATIVPAPVAPAPVAQVPSASVEDSAEQRTPAPEAVKATTKREAAARPGTLRSRIIAVLEEQPDVTQAEVARRLDADASNVSKVFKKLREDRPDLFTPASPEGESGATPVADQTVDVQPVQDAPTVDSGDLTAADAPVTATITAASTPEPDTSWPTPDDLTVPTGDSEAVDLIVVIDAKRELLDAVGGDKDRARDIWTTQKLPSDDNQKIRRADLAVAIDEAQKVLVRA